MAGRRAARAAGYTDLTPPELEHLAYVYADHDAPIAATMYPSDWVRFFVQGYQAKSARERTCP
jgi:hypothetical protein